MTEAPPTVDDDLVKQLRGQLDEAQTCRVDRNRRPENLLSQMNSAFGLPGKRSRGDARFHRRRDTADRSKISDPAVTFPRRVSSWQYERNPAVGSGHQVKEADMAAASILLSHQSQRLLQIGVALLLLLSLEGFAIPHLAAPHLGVSAHKLAALQSVLLLALGLVWPKLNLSAAISRIAFWLFIYSAFAILAAFLIGAISGAGNETMPLAAGAAHGTAFQETVIRVLAYSSAPTGIISFALILWGLRNPRPIEGAEGIA